MNARRIAGSIKKKILHAISCCRPSAIAYRRSQAGNMKMFREAFPGRVVIKLVDRQSSSSHAASPELVQFWFASEELYRIKPAEVLDIGSHLSWLAGIGSHYKIRTLDTRRRELSLSSEQQYVGVAQKLPFGDASQECVTSLCTLEHFGLGAYGDPVDPHGDAAAIEEIARVLKPKAAFVFTTTVTGAGGYIVFNARRVYDLPGLRRMLSPFFLPVSEKFFSMKKGRLVDEAGLSRNRGTYEFDLYLGSWERKTR
jgi:SAM-dependent methyltransferase